MVTVKLAQLVGIDQLDVAHPHQYCISYFLYSEAYLVVDQHAAVDESKALVFALPGYFVVVC